jgi:RimJ/RimL family protein N-acetyltransferase
MKQAPERYSTKRYRTLLTHALRLGYAFAGFVDDRPPGRYIYLRHDIDYSLRMAVELAKINQSMGVRGTFCVLLRSQVYNLLSSYGLEGAQQLLALGQRVAFHYAAPPILPAHNEELAALIRTDFEVVRRDLPQIEPAFAWHNPTPELLTRGLHLSVPGLVNIYSEAYTKTIPYYSDSNLRHSSADFEAILRRNGHAALHLLLHPLNWVAGGSTMTEVLGRTWRFIIREREEEIRLNHVYAKAFPQGMPEPLLQGFVEEWQEACGRALEDQWPTTAAASGRPPAIMTSRRVALTGLVAEDLPVLFRWINDHDLVIQNAPYRSVTKQQHKQWFEAIQRRKDVKIFAIRLLDSGKLIGSCQLHSIHDIHRSGELQIRLGEANEQHHGYGTEALQLLLRFAFQELNLHRISLQVFRSNEAAIRLYEKAGFVREGTFRRSACIDGEYLDVIVMGLLREEYAGR